MDIAGKKVINAVKPVVLEVTGADIKTGTNKNPSQCAAAQACLRQLKVVSARVHVGRTYIELSNHWVRYLTPPSLKSEIVAFDRGGTFEPSTHVLGAIPPAKATGKKQSHSKHASTPKKKRKRAYHITTGIRERGANK